MVAALLGECSPHRFFFFVLIASWELQTKEQTFFDSD